MRKRGTSKHCVYTVPSRQAIAVMRAKVSAATYRSNAAPGSGRAAVSAQLDAAWLGELLPARRVQEGVQQARLPRLASYLLLAPTRTGPHQLGQVRRRFCDQGWRFAHNGVVFTGRIQRRSDPLPLPRKQDHNSVDPEPSSPDQLTTGKTRGEPDAWRQARRVRRAGTGNPQPKGCTASRPRPN